MFIGLLGQAEQRRCQANSDLVAGDPRPVSRASNPPAIMICAQFVRITSMPFWTYAMPSRGSSDQNRLQIRPSSCARRICSFVTCRPNWIRSHEYRAAMSIETDGSFWLTRQARGISGAYSTAIRSADSVSKATYALLVNARLVKRSQTRLIVAPLGPTLLMWMLSPMRPSAISRTSSRRGI